MSGLSVGLVVPLFVLLILLATDAWVYADAKARTERGMPVVFSAGSFVVETPEAWFLGSLLLWVVFFPLYLTGRRDGVG